MKLRPAAWIALGMGAALLAYAFSGSASGVVPPGYMTLNVVAGLMSNLKAPSSGVAFVLPAGARWTTINVYQTSDPTHPSAIAAPPGGAPLLAAAVLAGTSYQLGWIDSAGAQQQSFAVFT